MVDRAADRPAGSPVDRRRSVARTLRAAAVALSVVILLVVALVGWSSWKESERSARTNGLGLQALVHSQVARMFDLGEVLLELVSGTVLQLDIDDPVAAEALNRDLALIDQALPLVLSIWVIDAEGDVVTSTVASSSGESRTINARDRAYFEAHKNGYAGTYVDGPYVGKLTGAPFFSVSRSIVDADGNFAGVAMVSFDTHAVAANLRSVKQSFGADVLLFRDSGQVLVSVPDREGDYVDWRVPPDIYDAAGTIDNADPDRVDSTFVWKLGDYPVFVAVTVPFTLAIEQWIGKNWHLWVSLIVSALAIALIYYTLRRRAVTEDRMAREMSEEIERQTGNLRRAVHEKDLLLRELHHRVKNNMQVVMSLLALQAQRSKGDPRTYFQESQRRLAAVAKMHQHLYLLADVAELSLIPYFRELAPEIAAAHGCEQVEIEVSGDEVSVGLDQATAIVLMAGEVMSNAFKHAFSEERGGRLTVRVSRTEGNGRLEIIDDGPGFPADEGQSDSLGMLLIRNLAIQAKGEVAYEGTNGGYFRLDFVIAPTVAAKEEQAARSETQK